MKADRARIEGVHRGRTLLIAELVEEIAQEDADGLPSIAMPLERALDGDHIFERPVAAHAVEAVDVADRVPLAILDHAEQEVILADLLGQTL